MPKFVRLGKRFVNLALITHVELPERSAQPEVGDHGAHVYFVGEPATANPFVVSTDDWPDLEKAMIGS